MYQSPSYDKPMYEFVLWPNCNNNCAFCWQKKIAKFTSTTEQKKEAIYLAKGYMLDKACEPGFDIMLVGGEIFDNTDIEEDFIDLAKFLRTLLLNDTIRYIYLNTNLIYEDNTFLKHFLDVFEHSLLKRFKLTTSYDVAGRFNEDKRSYFFRNLAEITSEYDVHFMANAILTKAVCNDLENAKDDKEALKELNASVYYLPYITLTETLRAEDDEVFTALETLYSKQELIAQIRSFDLQQKKFVLQYNPIDKFEDCTEELMECGHNKNFTRVLKSGECYICKMKQHFKSLLEDI